MINFSGAVTKWQDMQDNLIAFHKHTAVVSYPTSYSGTPFDDYANEGLDPNSPFSGLTGTVKPSVTVTGIAYLDVGEQSLQDSVKYTHAGRFEPGKAIFLCRISDATVSGQNIFSGASKVLLSVDSRSYVVKNWISTGMGEGYVYQVFLSRTQ